MDTQELNVRFYNLNLAAEYIFFWHLDFVKYKCVTGVDNLQTYCKAQGHVLEISLQCGDVHQLISW